MESPGKKRDPVGSYFKEKIAEQKENGKVVAMYSIGADIGFVRNHDGTKRPVVFEVNGKFSGFTIYKNKSVEKRVNPNYNFQKRFFREIRDSYSDYAIEKKMILYLRPLFSFMGFLEMSLSKVEEVKKVLSTSNADSIYSSMFAQIEKRNNAFISFVHDYIAFVNRLIHESCTKKDFEDFLEKYKSDDRILVDEHAKFLYEIVEMVHKDLGSATPKSAYDNLDGAEEVFEDKILQQHIIPEKYRIKTVNKLGLFYPKHGWFMVKEKNNFRGKGVFKMPFSKVMSIYFSKNRDTFLKRFLVQELVRTAGADNSPKGLEQNHSSMRLLLDVSVKKNSDGKLFVVVDSGGTTHNIYPKKEDMFAGKRSFLAQTPNWAKFEPSKGSSPFESSAEEVAMGTEVIKEIAIKTYEYLSKKDQ